ncbi:MAG: hypothetical protein LUQ36_03035 [Methanoregula sp.]|nr:hypothetical protein [Methanoregula sp.]
MYVLPVGSLTGRSQPVVLFISQSTIKSVLNLMGVLLAHGAAGWCTGSRSVHYPLMQPEEGIFPGLPCCTAGRVAVL